MSLTRYAAVKTDTRYPAKAQTALVAKTPCQGQLTASQAAERGLQHLPSSTQLLPQCLCATDCSKNNMLRQQAASEEQLWCSHQQHLQVGDCYCGCSVFSESESVDVLYVHKHCMWAYVLCSVLKVMTASGLCMQYVT